MMAVGMQYKQQDFAGIIERSLETSREVTGSSSCIDGCEQTGSRGGRAMSMSCEVITALKESILGTKQFVNILQNETWSFVRAD